MATTLQNHLPIDDEGNYLVEDKDYPGHTVDVLLEQGKVEQARAEFERLVMEGVESGPGIEGTPEFWEEMRSELSRKATGPSPLTDKNIRKLQISPTARRDIEEGPHIYSSRVAWQSRSGFLQRSPIR